MTLGTRGDVEPFLALALGLLRRGFQVRFATDLEFEALVRELGIAYCPINVRFLEAMRSPDGIAAIKGDKKAVARLKKEIYQPAVRQIFCDAWEAAQGADAIICNHALYYARLIAHKLDIPMLFGICSPFLSPTRAFPFMWLTNRDLGGFINRLSYLGIYQLVLQEYPFVKRVCRELGIDPGSRFSNVLRHRGGHIPVLYYFSPALLPRPGDWDPSARIIGYWHLGRHNDWQPPPALEKFLVQGPPPIYVGFGSMVTNSQVELSELVATALQLSGERAVLCAGEGGIADPGLDSVFYTDYIPFSWLFPRVKAVVHHGGTGVVNLGIKYGKPTVVCPLIADQAFWAARLHQQGIAPPPFASRYEGLTAHTLADAIKRAAGDAHMRERAEALGRELRAEDGVAEAVRTIEEYIGRGV